MIDTKKELVDFLDQCSRDGESLVCAVDTEADSLHRYSESLCLLQFSDGDRHVLIDPLAIEDMSALSGLLGNSVCWMHGADYDMHMLKQHLGVIPPTVFDTQIAAMVCGFGGLRVKNEQLTFKPWLPPGWDDIRFKFYWRGDQIAVTLKRDSMSFTLVDTADGNVQILVQDRECELTPGETVNVALNV